ncbi:MAG: hypothetical protein ACPGNT_00690 [Rhodospirillales bacterium]
MADTVAQLPTRVARVEERLQAALTRLEAAAEGLAARTGDPASDDDGTKAALVAEVDALRAEKAQLAPRLDAAIQRLSGLLGT